MKSFGFHVLKGGVGKTTISGSVGYYTASTGRKTLLIDGDPQGSLSSWFLTKLEGLKHELADILAGKVSVSDTIVQYNENLYFIPSFGINGMLKNYSETKLNDEPFIFVDLFEEFRSLNFDLIIYDLSPGMSRLEKSIILSLQEVITPFTPEYFGLEGLTIFTDELKKIRKNFRREIKHDKVVINLVNHSFRRHNLVMEEFKKMNYRLFFIPQDSKLAESQMVNKSIFEAYPDSKSIPSIKDIGNVILEVI
ncbi:MAG: ParA family protein [Brevinematales bacterium]|jgi:cellulose biosynthesis protein BcsQ